MLGFDNLRVGFDIKHRPGKSNTSADALSRNPCASDAVVGTVQSGEVRHNVREAEEVLIEQEELKKEQSADQFIVSMVDYLKCGKLPEDDVQ